ncbi:hypothetical protein U9M48_042304 [Paspalum notatum var. saurae]|uniref:PGG domain-containing protein n=1 Tax=Paspalum notatum var. saurae TaxID=547442 RepID=A0AAQ3XG17_PASNO
MSPARLMISRRQPKPRAALSIYSSKPQEFQCLPLDLGMDHTSTRSRSLPEADAGKTAPGVTTADGECSNQQMIDYLDKMHGWLLTVATLFVGMAFQVGAHPPDWIKAARSDAIHRAIAAAAPAPASAPSPSQGITYIVSGSGIILFGSARATVFIVLNAFTFASALALVLSLLCRGTLKSGFVLLQMKLLVAGIAISFAVMYALCAPADWIGVFMVGACTMMWGVSPLIIFYIGQNKSRLYKLFNLK